jgi:hypothetical protein
MALKPYFRSKIHNILKKNLLVFLVLLVSFAKGNILNGDTLEVCPLKFPIVLRAAPGAQQYVWSNGSRADTTLIFTAGKYWVQIFNNGNIFSDTILIIAKKLTVETFAAENLLLCRADTPWQVISNRVFDNHGIWNTGHRFILQTARDGRYWFTSVDTHFCLQQTDTVEIFGLPDSSMLHFSTQQFICESAFPVTIYMRYGDNPVWNDGSTQPDLLIDSDGVYTYQSLVGNCAQVFDTIIVTSKSVVAPVLCCDTIVCYPDSVFLRLPGGFTDYYWSTGQNAQSIFLSNIGVFSVNVTVTDHTNCAGVTNTITVEIKDSIPKPSIQENGNFLIAQPTGFSYRWYKNDSLLAGQTASFLPFSRSGKYCVVMSNGVCEDTACIHFSVPSAFQHLHPSFTQVFPNPAEYFLTVKSAEDIESIYMSNIFGTEWKLPASYIHPRLIEINTSEMPSGVYLLSIQFSGHRQVKKVIINHP